MKISLIVILGFTCGILRAQPNRISSGDRTHEVGVVMYNLRIESRFSRTPIALSPEAVLPGLVYRYQKRDISYRVGAAYRMGKGNIIDGLKPIAQTHWLVASPSLPRSVSTKQWELNCGIDYIYEKRQFKPYLFLLGGFRKTSTTLNDEYFEFLAQGAECMTGVILPTGKFHYNENSVIINQGIGLRFEPGSKFSLSLETGYEAAVGWLFVNGQKQNREQLVINMIPLRILVTYRL